MPLTDIQEIVLTDTPYGGITKVNENFDKVVAYIDNLENVVLPSINVDSYLNPPDVFEEEIVVDPIAVSGVETFSIEIPYNRLYGVYVGVAGLLTDQSVKVEFLGNDSPEEIQYVADFTEELTEDTAQAWRYRDSLAENLLRVRLTNLGLSELNITLTIRAEPF